MITRTIFLNGVEVPSINVVEDCCVAIKFVVKITGVDFYNIYDGQNCQDIVIESEDPTCIGECFIFQDEEEGYAEFTFNDLRVCYGVKHQVNIIVHEENNFYNINAIDVSRNEFEFVSCTDSLESNFEEPIPACAQFPNNENQDLVLSILASFPDLSDYRVKLNSSGFFGLFDKSNACANTIMDFHYLFTLLHFMHIEKRNDAIQCGGCRISKHPLYYINSYNICCIYEYFNCKKIDILPILKAAKIDKVYSYECNQEYVGLGIKLPKITFEDLSNYSICPPKTSTTTVLYPEDCGCSPEEPTDTTTICACCIEDVKSDCSYLFDAIVFMDDFVPNTICNDLFSARLDENSEDFYSPRLDENFPCNEPYSPRLNEIICQ